MESQRVREPVEGFTLTLLDADRKEVFSVKGVAAPQGLEIDIKKDGKLQYLSYDGKPGEPVGGKVQLAGGDQGAKPQEPALAEVPADYRDPTPFKFQKGDVVAILGNGLAERMQHGRLAGNGCPRSCQASKCVFAQPERERRPAEFVSMALVADPARSCIRGRRSGAPRRAPCLRAGRSRRAPRGRASSSCGRPRARRRGPRGRPRRPRVRPAPIDEDGAAVGQLADHVPVVDDLLAHVDRGAEVLERPLDRVDGPVDTGAVAAWRCQHELSGNHAAYGNGDAGQTRHTSCAPGPGRLAGMAPSAPGTWSR